MTTQIYTYIASISITEQPMGFPFVIEVEDRDGNKITLNLDSSDETTKWHLSLLCHHDSAIRESADLSKQKIDPYLQTR